MGDYSDYLGRNSVVSKPEPVENITRQAPATPMDCLIQLQGVNDKLVGIIKERDYLLNQYQEMSHAQIEYADNAAKSFNELLSQLSRLSQIVIE